MRSYAEEGRRRIKPLLCMFRVALSGVHLLREGRVLADLELLLERYRLPAVGELFALKQRAEQATVEDDRPYLELVPRLEALLAEAHDRSPLPEQASAPELLDAWLKRWRQWQVKRTGQNNDD